MRRLGTWIAATLVIGTIGVAGNARAEERIPVDPPTVAGPIEGGLKGHPLAANPYDLAAFGYVEEEYFVSGTASRLVGDTWGAEAPYTTRILVRRPTDPASFNGSVMLEWLNVTTGVGVPVDWTWYDAEVLRAGYVYATVDAQAAGVATLHAYDPVRYRELVHPGDDYSYDILSQIALAIRRPGEIDPTGGLTVERVYAGGSSQSCSRLNTYIASIHPLVERVVDGFLPSVCGGTLPTGIDVPVLRLNSMNEVSSTVPQDDFSMYRLWEIAGAAHSDKDWAVQARAAGARDWGDPTNTFPLVPADYNRPDKQCLINRFPKKYAYRAGLHALDVWVKDGTPAPAAPRITRDGNGAVRDSLGNALGGLRLPAIEVPTAAYNNDPLDCEVLQGRTDPFSEQLLRQRYPTKGDYLAAVNRAVGNARRNGHLLDADAHEIRAQATGFTWTYVWHGDDGPAALLPNPTGWLEENM